MGKQLERERRELHRELHATSQEVTHERMDGQKNLTAEKWEAHAREHIRHDHEHAMIASNFQSYKSESNEWRSALNDLRGTFMPRVEIDFERAEQNRRLDQLEDAAIRSVGRREGSVTARAFIYGTISIIATVIGAAILILSLKQ